MTGAFESTLANCWAYVSGASGFKGIHEHAANDAPTPAKWECVKRTCSPIKFVDDADRLTSYTLYMDPSEYWGNTGPKTDGWLYMGLQMYSKATVQCADGMGL